LDIGAWLHGLGLQQYEPAFRANDIDADLLSELTEADLERLGMTSLGHRKKLLKAIQALQAEALTTHPIAMPRGARLGRPKQVLPNAAI
jgi:hypothetical protein